MPAVRPSPETYPRPTDLAVIGGGVIGLTCALAAADAGLRVVVHDAGPGRRASQVAGGMLGSLGEGIPGEERLLAISSASVARWPQLLDRLDEVSPSETPHRPVRTATDSLFVGTSSADLRELDRLAETSWDASLVPGREVRRIDPAQVRDLEPALSARVRGGYLVTGEGAVDNRLLLLRLRAALLAAGGTVIDGPVSSLDDVHAGQVLIAAGAGVRRLWPQAPIHLLKGEILRLRRTPWSVPPPTRVIRARVDGRVVYLVPRDDGIVLGATQYESDDESSGADVGGVTDLLADAAEVLPGLRGYELAEVGVGFRPCTPDALPIIRRLDERTCVAAGFGRNGIVLAPYAAAEVQRLLGLAAKLTAAGTGGEGR
ncbi:FAD-dependent oxidoreductase [Gordonia sp. NPDC003429]